MIEFLAEWLVTFLIPATHVIRSEGTSSFLYVPQGIRELYLGLKSQHRLTDLNRTRES